MTLQKVPRQHLSPSEFWPAWPLRLSCCTSPQSFVVVLLGLWVAARVAGAASRMVP